jgi:mRNA interferase RelE/StbE
MYEIFFTDKTRRQFLGLEKGIQRRIAAALERIRVRPEQYVTKLVGDPAYKLRAGDYRVLMDINRGKLIILVIKVGHRKNVYP